MCSSSLNCSMLRRNAVVAKAAGMDWSTSNGSNDMVCGESEVAFASREKAGLSTIPQSSGRDQSIPSFHSHFPCLVCIVIKTCLQAPFQGSAILLLNPKSLIQATSPPRKRSATAPTLTISPGAPHNISVARQLFFPRPIPPSFPVLARACPWCLGARVWRVDLPWGVKKHTESAFCFNTAHSVSNLGTGRMGARMCSMDEMLSGEAAGTGCGSTMKLAWTRSAGGYPRGQYVAVTSTPGQSAVGNNWLECRDKTDSLEVRCCADVAAGRGRNVCAGSLHPAHVVRHCTSASSCSDLAKRFGGWGMDNDPGGTSCGEADNGPSQPHFHALPCAARTLNAAGQSRVTLSLRREHV